MNIDVKRTTARALLAAAALAASALAASASPNGVWLDHTGRAAVEISNCGNNICGRIVWLKDASNNSAACGLQIIGDVKPVSGGKWDKGWILDPEKDSKYDVEITPMGERLKVMGYAGIKMLSETFTWTRAPADLKRCDARSADRTPPGGDIPFTPPAPPSGPGPSATPGPIATPGPGPSTGPGPVPQPEQAPPPEKRRGAKKECKFELPGFKLSIPCDDD